MEEHRLRLEGTLTGLVGWELSDDCQPHQPVRTHWRADGQLRPLGRVHASATHCADDKGGGVNGHVVFQDEQGDELVARYVFRKQSQLPPLLVLEMIGQLVSGGTGRFARARGEFVATVNVQTGTTPPTTDTVWPIALEFAGEMTVPAAP